MTGPYMTQPVMKHIRQLTPPFLKKAIFRQRGFTGRTPSSYRTLSSVVRDLMLEIEALRANAATSPEYKTAYLETCLDAHNNCGPSSGWDKLVAKFYPSTRNDKDRVWRESIMLRRLDYQESDIESFQAKAEEMELYT